MRSLKSGWNPTMLTSKFDGWATPQALFDSLDAEFHFDLDPCACPETAKCKRFYTGIEGLMQPWEGRVFVNPPFGRPLKEWVARCAGACSNGAEIVVALLPVRTDTAWWHDFADRAEERRFLRGRLKFGEAKNSAPFPSAVVVFRGVDDERRKGRNDG